MGFEPVVGNQRKVLERNLLIDLGHLAFDVIDRARHDQPRVEHPLKHGPTALAQQNREEVRGKFREKRHDAFFHFFVGRLSCLGDIQEAQQALPLSGAECLPALGRAFPVGGILDTCPSHGRKIATGKTLLARPTRRVRTAR